MSGHGPKFSVQLSLSARKLNRVNAVQVSAGHIGAQFESEKSSAVTIAVSAGARQRAAAGVPLPLSDCDGRASVIPGFVVAAAGRSKSFHFLFPRGHVECLVWRARRGP